MLISIGSTLRSSASLVGSLAPMTVRRITSRVISDIRGATANSESTGHAATLAAVISAIASAWRATAFRLNGASMRRRRSACTSSSTTSTELSPSSPLNIEFASPAWRMRGSPANTSLMSAGSARYTSVPIDAIRSREHTAVTVPAGGYEARPVTRHQCGLDPPGQRWTRWQRGRGSVHRHQPTSAKCRCGGEWPVNDRRTVRSHSGERTVRPRH